MKKLIFSLVIIFLLSISFANDPISFDEAMAISIKQNKPVLIDVFTDW